MDSCVLLDVVKDDPKWSEWSAERLAEARDEGLLVINLLVFEASSCDLYGEHMLLV